MYKFIYHTKNILVLALTAKKLIHHSNPHHVIFLTPFGVKYDGRVQKSVDSLLRIGYAVEIIKPQDIQDDDIESWHTNLTITPLGLSGSYSHFPYIFDWKVADHIRKSSASHIICRDLFTGIMGIKAGHSSGKHVTVDFYEWYSQSRDYDYSVQTTKPKPFWKQIIFRFYERYICRYADHLITNNLSFARGISQNIIPVEKFSIIRNMPDATPYQEIQKDYDLRQFIPQHLKQKTLLYYAGQLSFDRKLDTILEGMKYLESCILVIQGSGYETIQKKYAHIINQKNVKNRVFFIPPVHHKDIIKYASSADIGVFICDTQDNKMFHALPNKLFEYVWAGIPQISCYGAEINPIFDLYQIGEQFDAYDPYRFSQAVQKIMDPENYKMKKQNTLAYQEYLFKKNDWDVLSKILHTNHFI